jgi:hypothetical protein
VGRIWFPSVSFCLCVAVLSVYRTRTVWGRGQEQLPCLRYAVPEVLKYSDEQLRRNWTIGECGNEDTKTHTHKSRFPYIVLVTELFTIHPK